jgi:hypothetical protein
MAAILTPAYGRDYKNKKECLADFESGKDFIYNTFNGQTYCNKEDLTKQGVPQVNIRYKNNTQLIVVKLS